jgi:hypothetical protein
MNRIKIFGLLAAVCLLALMVGLMVRSPGTKASDLKGAIYSVSDNTMVVDGRTVLINETTHIKGTLTAGAVVEIKAIVQEDGSLLAIKMEVKDDDDEGDCKHSSQDCDDDDSDDDEDDD